MLFDLRGKRKRVIQVIYVGLALLMGVGLVGLGIGGDASGGIFDALGIGSSGTQQSDPAYDRQIEEAEATLAENPKDQRALLKLARTHFLAAQTALETDDQGQPVLNEDALAEYRAAGEAWERYLATDPKKPDDGVATLMMRAYSTIAGTDTARVATDLEQAYKAARIVAEARPSVGSYTQLAVYAYLANQAKAGEEAERKALAEADSGNRAQVKSQIDQAKKQGKSIAKQLEADAPDKSELQNPLGGAAPGAAAPAP